MKKREGPALRWLDPLDEIRVALIIQGGVVLASHGGKGIL